MSNTIMSNNASNTMSNNALNTVSSDNDECVCCKSTILECYT